MATRKRRTTAQVRSTRSRTTSKRRTVRRTPQQKIVKKLMTKVQQAKRQERLALAKLNLIVRQHKMTINQLRRIVAAKLKEKARNYAKIRKQLLKKHQLFIAKIRREHQAELNRLRRELSGKSIKRKTTSRRRKSTSAKRRTKVKYIQPSTSRKVVPFKRRARGSRRRSYRKAA